MVTPEEQSNESTQDYQGKDIPKSKRIYVKPGEAAPEDASRTYIGPDGGTFYDSRETTASHIKSQGNPKGEENSLFPGLTHHPEHGPNIVEWDSGETGPQNEPPKRKEGEKKAKVAKVVERNQAETIAGYPIPLEATEVHVSLDPDARVQAKYRNKNRKLVALIHSAAKAKKREKHWSDYESFVKHKLKLSRAMSKLAQNPEEMDDTDSIIYVIRKTALRHGDKNKENTNARGGSTLQVRDVTIEGEDKVHFALPTKAGMFTEITIKDPTLVRILRPRMKGKNPTDRIFNSGQRKNNERLRKHLGGEGVEGVSMKSIRTHAATDLALQEVTRLLQGTAPPKRAKTQAEYKKLEAKIGLKVGTLLGHKRQLNDDDGNPTDPPKYEFTAATALGSYISPTFFDKLAAHFAPIKESTDIQKAFTPDWRAKGPDKERDIDEYAEARKRKGENRQWGIKDLGGHHKLAKNHQPITWMDSLVAQGFTAPMIKEVLADGSKMWFISNGVDYIANLGGAGNTFVEKAVFKPMVNLRKVSRKPETPSNPVISLDNMIEDAQ